MSFTTMRGAAAADKIITNGDPALNDAVSHTSFDVYFQGDNGTDVADNDILLSVNEAGKQGAEGGGGNDSFEFVNTSGVVGQVVASGGAGNDSFEFTSDVANNAVARLTDSDIAGGAGEDTFDLTGGSQSTTVRGGAGVDTFTLRGNYNNTIIKGGADGDVVEQAVDATTASGFADISLSNSKIRGQGGNDGGILFNGSVASDSSTINGNAGNDEIRFNAAFGIITGLTIGGGTGDDLIRLTGAAAADGGADGIQFNGGSGIDRIETGAADDLINGGEGNDTVFAFGGADNILGGTGNDFVDAGAGNDTINGEDGNDTITGGAGADSILGVAGADSLVGNAGNDTLDGGASNDVLDGGLGNDSLIGGEGGDTIITGDAGVINTGDDTIMGGEGGDFIFLGTSTTVFGETDENKSMITAISDSEAAVDQFDVISGFNGALAAGIDPTDATRTSNFTLDIESVKDVLAGSNATSVALNPLGTVATTGTTNATRFASLLTAFNNPVTPLMTASDNGTIQGYLFDANLRGTTQAYLVLNDPNAALTSGDLMVEFVGTTSANLLTQIGATNANGVIDLG